jgi:hypothetical protein
VKRIRLLGNLGLVIVIATLGPAFCQGGAGRGARQRPKVETRNPTQEPLAAFSGTVKQIDGKGLALEDLDSNVTQFHCNKKTQYYQEARKIDRSAVKPGDQVTVEARRAPDWSFDALIVHLEHKGDTALPAPR